MYVEDDGHTAPIEKEIRQLSSALEAVKDEQEYIVVRERLHRDSECACTLQDTSTHSLISVIAQSSHSGRKYKQQSQVLVDHSDRDAVCCVWLANLLPQTVSTTHSEGRPPAPLASFGIKVATIARLLNFCSPAFPPLPWTS